MDAMDRPIDPGTQIRRKLRKLVVPASATLLTAEWDIKVLELESFKFELERNGKVFDRGLIGIRDDYSLIISHNKVPEEMRYLFGKREQRIHLPGDEKLHPNPFYLAKHRERFCL